MQTQTKHAAAGLIPQPHALPQPQPPSALSTSSSTPPARGDDPSRDSRPTTSNPTLVSTLDKATPAAGGLQPVTHAARSDFPIASGLATAAHDSTSDASTLAFPTPRLATLRSATPISGTSADAGAIPATLPRPPSRASARHSSNVGPAAAVQVVAANAKHKPPSLRSRSRSAQADDDIVAAPPVPVAAPAPSPAHVAAPAPFPAHVLSPRLQGPRSSLCLHHTRRLPCPHRPCPMPLR